MPLQVSLLEESFDLVAPRGEEVVERFSERLFNSAPEVWPRFAGTNLRRQRQLLLDSLILLRNSLRNPGTIVPMVQALGVRHASWSLRPEHYPIVAAALLASLAEIGGNDWLDRYTLAWADAYMLIQDTMLGGAAAHREDGCASSRRGVRRADAIRRTRVRRSESSRSHRRRRTATPLLARSYGV
jgi:hemoglobin-like flavoprotein